MKNFLLLIAATFMTTAIHAGTGVGGGDDGDPSRRQQQLEDEFARTRTSGTQYLYDWCANTTRILNRELRAAKTLMARGELTQAKNRLVGALKSAGGSFNTKYKVKPMTKKLIDRGVKYLNVINNLNWDMPERFKVVSQLNFLESYIELVIETERSLDRPYHIPYHYEYNGCRNGCGSFSISSYESAFVQQMRKELNFVADTFTMHGQEDSIMPVGSVEIYLKTAEILTLGVATDLAENLYSYQNSCAVVDLESLSYAVSDFVWHDDQSYFVNERHAVDETTREMRRIAETLYPKYYSHSNSHNSSNHGYNSNSRSDSDYGYRPEGSTSYGYPQKSCRN